MTCESRCRYSIINIPLTGARAKVEWRRYHSRSALGKGMKEKGTTNSKNNSIKLKCVPAIKSRAIEAAFHAPGLSEMLKSHDSSFSTSTKFVRIVTRYILRPTGFMLASKGTAGNYNTQTVRLFSLSNLKAGSAWLRMLIFLR
jgi:hypothetical protein